MSIYSHTNVGGNCKFYTSCETTIANSCLILSNQPPSHIYQVCSLLPGSTLLAVSKNRKGRLGDLSCAVTSHKSRGAGPNHQTLHSSATVAIVRSCQCQMYQTRAVTVLTFQPLVHVQDATKIGFKVHYSTLRPVCLPNNT